MRILVTGATGNVGASTVAALVARGATVRAAVPRPTEVPGAEAARFDFADRATWEVAAGCDALFLLRPPPIGDTRRTLVPFVDAARAAGVHKVVFLSVVGAERTRWVPHHAVEVHLRSTPGRWTILQAGFFAQNLGDAYRRDIAEDGRLYVPAGRGRVAWVDVRDIAEVAADALLGAHDGLAPVLTGPEALDFDQAAEILSVALDRRVDYRPASVLGYAAHLRRRGLPWSQIGVQTVLHVGLRFGQAATVDPTLGRLLQRPPRPLAQYVEEHRARWL